MLKPKAQKIIESILAIVVILLVTTLDSEWTKEYFTFVGINLAIATPCIYLLVNHGNYQ